MRKSSRAALRVGCVLGGFFLAGALWLGGGLAGPALAQSTAATAWSDDRHAGYYYPEPTSEEVYTARAQTLPQSNRASRVGFVTAFTARQLERPVSPEFVMFAKGADAQKLIIVSLDDDRVNSLYRARALFAMMTAMARVLPVFTEFGVEDSFTFFDLAKLLGFTQITISDGHDFAHQVILE